MSAFDAFARFYDADYGAFADDVPFYRAMARRTGGPILELMCGSGRLLEPLARDGHHVTGVDVSAALLGVARHKLAIAGLLNQAELVEADVRQAVPPGPFAMAIVGLNSFMHLETTDDQLAVLSHVHESLRPGGVLVLDLYNPDPRELIRHNGEMVLDKTFSFGDGGQVQKFVVQSADLAAQTSHVVFMYDEIDADGSVRRTTLPFSMRWIYRYEIEHLLARSGFVIEAVYGSYDLDEFGSASELMLTVATRDDEES